MSSVPAEIEDSKPRAVETLPTVMNTDSSSNSKTISGSLPAAVSDNNNTTSNSIHAVAQVEDESQDDCAGDDGDIQDDDESEYSYEDEDEGAFSSFLATDQYNAAAAVAASSSTTNDNAAAASSSSPALIENDTAAAAAAAPRKSKWKEPTREAVNMSLRAERETTGGKRRLASELYKIMMRDTQEAGFSICPSLEDSMDKWTIKLFQFDQDSNLSKDLLVLGLDHVELEMTFGDDYPFSPPFVRVVRPKFKRQTGFVMNGALCMELLTTDGWNPINDIESVIVSIRSLLVVGDGRLAAAADLSEEKRRAILASRKRKSNDNGKQQGNDDDKQKNHDDKDRHQDEKKAAKITKSDVGSYSLHEAQSAYTHLSDYHKKKGWDTSGWWAKKG